MSLFGEGINLIGSGLDSLFGTGTVGEFGEVGGMFGDAAHDASSFFDNELGGQAAGNFLSNNFGGAGTALGALALGGSGTSSASHSSAVPRDIINTGQVRTAQDPLAAAGKLRGTQSVDPQAIWSQWMARMHYTAKSQVG